MKIVWLSNVILSEKDSINTGSWVQSLALILSKHSEIELFNITEAKTRIIKKEKIFNITQVLIPNYKKKRDGLPTKRRISQIKEIVNNINPEIVHIWGTEKFWGLLTSRKIISHNTLIEIQGLKHIIHKYFYQGLSFNDIIDCINFKDLLFPSRSIVGQKISYAKWSKFEIEIIKNHKHISTQSDWTRSHIRFINSKTQIYNSHIALREEFYKSAKWEYVNCNKYELFSIVSSTSISYKGLHVLIRAISILKEKYPDINLRIGGHYSMGLRKTGYFTFLQKLIKKFGLENNISFVGSLDSLQIINSLLRAHVTVVPSFIESYCLALEESLFIGTPTVASFAGAMPEMSRKYNNIYFFPSGDVYILSSRIDEILSKDISSFKYKPKCTLQSTEDQIYQKQIQIYNSILNNE